MTLPLRTTCPARRPSCSTWRPALDEYEGLDRGLYEKREIEVELNGERWNALVYVSLRLPLTMETFRADYLENIKRAARDLGLSAATQDRYAQVRVVRA